MVAVAVDAVYLEPAGPSQSTITATRPPGLNSERSTSIDG
jgi:hypothetical protein